VKKIIILLSILLIGLLIGCESLYLESRRYPAFQKHPEFTTTNMLKIETGMTSTEVIEIFGPPDRTGAETYGSKTKNPWKALVFKYNMGPHPDGVFQTMDNINTFAFSDYLGVRYLEYWDLQLVHPEKKK